MIERGYTPTGPGAGTGQLGQGGRSGRRLLGCALGCLVVVIGIVAMFSLAWWWVSSPGPQVATEPIVPEDAVAALRIEGLGEDEGFTELAIETLTRFDAAAREVQQQQLPENLRWISALGRRPPRARELQRWLPREITVAVEAAPDSDDGYSVVTAVNLSRYPRLIRFLVLRFFVGDEGRRWERQGHPIVENSDMTIAFVGSTMLISDDVAATERAVDELAGAPAFGDQAFGDQAFSDQGEAPTSARGVESARLLGALAARHPGEWDVHGGFLNRESVLAYAWWDLFRSDDESGVEDGTGEQLEIETDDGPEGRPVLDPDFLRSAEGVEASWMAFDFETADSVRAAMAFECHDAAAAEAWAKVVEADLDRVLSAAVERGLGVSRTATVTGSRLDVELRATEIRAWLDEGIGDFVATMMNLATASADSAEEGGVPEEGGPPEEGGVD